jgi:imidazolonepropionase
MSNDHPFDCVIDNARVVTCAGPGKDAATELGVVENGAVGIRDGIVAWIGDRGDDALKNTEQRVDAKGGALLPGFVDCHTHLAFAGGRVDEFARKMAGEDYRAISESGGGIASTVRATRAASDADLYEATRKRALRMRALGTTTVEVKSGYGLTLSDELRLLRVGRRLAAEGVVRTTTTFLGAHAVPPERKQDRGGYLAEVRDAMLAAVVAERLADACDVYIDDGAFTLAEGRAVLEAAKALGLRVKAHAGQFADLGAAELIAYLGGLSADHLEQASDGALATMAKASVTGVLLPGAWSTLRQTPPDAARFRRAGVPMAVATDCNPGTSPSLDLPLMAALAVRNAGLTAEEAVLAITARAGESIGSPVAGRIAVGAPADLVLYADDDPRSIAYALGGLVPRHVWLGGRLVQSEAETATWSR